MDLFAAAQRDQALAPLAVRMRPRTLDEFVGQQHLLGPGRVLRRAIETDLLGSTILYGPPGTGKTTLARVIASHTKAYFVSLNASNAGVAEVKRVIDEARDRRKFHGQRTTVFLDEIQRFNRSQQDTLLGAVEDGTITLIGATTENPFFEINNSLLSRSRLFTLEPLTVGDIKEIVRRACQDQVRGLGTLHVFLTDEAMDHLAHASQGDARIALGVLELAALTARQGEGGKRCIDLPIIEEVLQRPVVRYDKSGDTHYDVVSAFIKSMRGSDPDAALYWFARMLAANEDPRFIVRRIIVHASEDVGLADPQAMLLAHAAANALEWVGMPEAAIPMAQAIVYIATAPKSNAIVKALAAAQEDVRRLPHHPVPAHLRDASYGGAARLGHGEGYLYPHDFPGHYVKQAYRPANVEGRVYYEPTDQGDEARVKARQQGRQV